MGIYGFSLIRIFPYMSLDSVHMWENLAERKPLYLHILCSVQLSLLVNVGTTFFSNALLKFWAKLIFQEIDSRVVLKRQASSLAEVDVWVPHGSTFGPLLFLIYINDSAVDVLNPKQFETDISLFSVVYNVNTSADEVNNDLVRSNKCAYQGKMSFSADPIK